MKRGDVYRHYKGGLYWIDGLAKLEADQTDVVVYRRVTAAGYEHNRLPGSQLWVRPLDEFQGMVEHEGKLVPRFQVLTSSWFDGNPR